MENVRGKNTKRKHLSKNKKKSWRKINTDDVDDFLEEERLQERTGGKAREKTNDALFFIDKIVKEPKKKFEGVQKRKRKAQDALGDIEVTLKPPPPAKKDKRAPDVIAKLEKKQSTKKPTVNTRERPKRTESRYAVTYDLWSDDTTNTKEDLHYLRQTRKLQIAAPEHLKKAPSKQPKLKIPHPGASYNPAYDDHQDLLLKAHIVELEKLREEERIRRALDDKFPTAADRPTDASKLKEMSAGLFDESDEDDDSDDDRELDLDKISVNPPVRRDNKKNERQRKKEKRRKEEDKKRQEEKLRKMKDNNVFRLKAIKKEIIAKEKLIAEKEQKRKEKEEQDEYETKRLGKMKFIEPDLEVQLTDDLVGSLRELRPEGDLLEDRFNSFQRRNMIAPRNQTKRKKKYKPKKFEKRGQGHLMKS